VVIIDMPVLKENFSLSVQKRIAGIYNMHAPMKTFDNCKDIGEEIEKYFEYGLKKQAHKIKNLKYIDRFEAFANFFHGYHVLNTVAENNNESIYIIGVRPAITATELTNIDRYLNHELEKEFIHISKTLLKIKPDFVNVSGSESIDINENFFLQNNVSKDDSLKYAKIIFNKWNEFWKRTIKSLPKTTFVVSAGNGGSDWIGDKLVKGSQVKTQTTPATLNLPNIVTISSISTTGISSFSNYGKLVAAEELGEMYSANIPCVGKKRVKLTGSSQATAIHTSKLLR
jgi:hypothetical protein